MDRVQIAQDLAKNEVFNQAIEDIKSQLYSDWLNSTAHATTDREQLWLQTKLVEKLRGEIISVVEGGTISDHINNLKEL